MFKSIGIEYKKNMIFYNSFILFGILLNILSYTSIEKTYVNSFFDLDILVVFILLFSVLYYVFQKRILGLEIENKSAKVFSSKLIICFMIYVIHLFILYGVVNPYYNHLNLVLFKYEKGIDLLKFFSLVYFLGILPISFSVLNFVIKKSKNWKTISKSPIRLYPILFYIVNVLFFYRFYDMFYHLAIRHMIIGFYFFITTMIVLFILNVYRKLGEVGNVYENL